RTRNGGLRPGGPVRGKEVLVPGVGGRPRVGRGRVRRAAVLARGVVETGDKAGQGGGVADGVLGREPGHPALGFAVRVVPLGAEVEDGNTDIRIPFHRDEKRVAGPLRGAASLRCEGAEREPDWSAGGRGRRPRARRGRRCRGGRRRGGGRGGRARREGDDRGRRGRRGRGRAERGRRRGTQR